MNDFEMIVQAYEASGGDPQLRGHVGFRSRKHGHPSIGDGVKNVQAAHENVGDADDHEIGIVNGPADVPDEHEDRHGDGDPEHLGEVMEEDLVAKSDQAEAGEGQSQ